MNLSEIQIGQKIMVDANIFIYASQRASIQCVKLLEKCANNEVMGIITDNILSEVMHVLMIAEAKDIGLIKGPNPARQLSENIQLVKSLNRYEVLIRDLLAIGLHLESLQREDFITALQHQRQYGMLTNDALFLAVATRLRITALASADSIFSKAQGIFLYSPDDLNENLENPINLP